MAIKVIYLDTAVQDLASIYKYISKDSIKYARLEVQKIKSFTESLKDNPFKGTEFKIVRNQVVRNIVFRKYLIFYSVSDNQINILTIHHHARLITNNPAFKADE